ncbi:hypothetical protein BpHYR1_038534 [Brachionus plicatilis]|uniref:Uncharacterized protein n=1 Tax=Brachionus plicatilis TaxID=10195 RepID=A0A3M7QS53_BRAPC|nr:hypothetical protein BpHYR1_038534 [Brachionus plicatilis]
MTWYIVKCRIFLRSSPLLWRMKRTELSTTNSVTLYVSLDSKMSKLMSKKEKKSKKLLPRKKRNSIIIL